MTSINYSRTRIEGEPLMFLLTVVLNLRLRKLPDGSIRTEFQCRQAALEAFMRAHERVVQRMATADSRMANARRRSEGALADDALWTLIFEVLDALPPIVRAQAAEVIAPAFAVLDARPTSKRNAGRVSPRATERYDSGRG